MLRYAVTRLLQGILLIFTVSVLVFSLLYMMPGDPLETMAGQRVAPERKAELRHELGLDRPLHEQYLSWMRSVLQLDFGKSIATKLPVMQSLRHRIPITVNLALWALAVQLLIAVPLGLLAAYRKDSVLDRCLMGAASFLQSVPNFWLAMLLILFFGASLQWLPLNGYGSWRHNILPVISIAAGSIAGTLRMTKAEVLEVFREKFVLTAYAKGLPGRLVIVRHVLRNSLILVTVMVFMTLPWLISGSVIIEQIFVIPGMGSLLTKAISAKDFPIVQACILIITVLTVIANLLSDLLLALLDPRIRIEIAGGSRT